MFIGLENPTSLVRIISCGLFLGIAATAFGKIRVVPTVPCGALTTPRAV